MVLLDNVRAAYELTSHLIENGYRNFAGLFGNASTTGKERQRGFQDALDRHGLRPASVHFIEPRIKHGYEKTKELLAESERPDAIFTSNSLHSWRFPGDLGLHLTVPDELLLWLDKRPGALVIHPLPSSRSQRRNWPTAMSVSSENCRPERAPKTVIMKGKLQIRGSSAPRLR
jgi:LacI family fructose operon transcriptional repressor